MALGASRAQVTRLVVGECLRLCGFGVALGLAASVPLTRLLGGVLFGVGPSDPVALAAASAALILVSVLACYIPLGVRSRVDPMSTRRMNNLPGIPGSEAKRFYGKVTTATASPPRVTSSPPSWDAAGGWKAVCWSTTSNCPPEAPGTDATTVHIRLFTSSTLRLPS